MGKLLNVPPELDQLIEKRDRDDRRGAERRRPSGGSQKRPLTGERRKTRDRRRAARRKTDGK